MSPNEYRSLSVEFLLRVGLAASPGLPRLMLLKTAIALRDFRALLSARGSDWDLQLKKQCFRPLIETKSHAEIKIYLVDQLSKFEVIKLAFSEDTTSYRCTAYKKKA